MNHKCYNALMNTVETYTQKNITFILHCDKTLVVTPHQTFILEPARHNYAKKLEVLREQIRQGEMKTLTDVVAFCNLRPGKGGQMLGIYMMNTKLDRHILT